MSQPLLVGSIQSSLQDGHLALEFRILRIGVFYQLLQSLVVGVELTDGIDLTSLHLLFGRELLPQTL